ncbi:ATP-binding cassette domain-containing protein [Mesorhizobium sp. BAC0120]|uniref:ATP-binding cassette domain-containing protein n=1 Tax=Mesorhizobium sp. BAC0120 TaxID=3090670 RepID=UPI00298C7158|nr:ATP-binding cassette domain-containing protein [Mesorhizobium sp. BAC0120]MDW6024842.1 ATP-binding cassette domain-containing protein [Mesorhizobium sp. BAC0120]
MADAGVRLSARGVALKTDAEPFDLDIRAGEIVGLAGLDGHGQEQFIEMLAGLRAPARGSVVAVRGDAEHPITSLRKAISGGVAYLPRDRRATGIFPTMSILDNFAMATVDLDRRFGLISKRDRRRRYEYYRKRLSIVAQQPGNAIITLSGGNQQKVLLARALAHRPDVLLLNDPTRGVDIATRQTLYAVFRELAAEGVGLIILSTEIEEVLLLCSRILVFREQQVASTVAGDDRSPEHIISVMFGRRQ